MLSRWFSAPPSNAVETPGFGDSKTNVLDVVPVVNAAVRVEWQSPGALLWVPIQPRWWMGPPLSWLLPYRRERGIALDGLGRQVLEACDGKSSVERIVERFADAHRLRFHEARQSVLVFLKMLLERKVIAFVVPSSSSVQAIGASPGETGD